MKKRLAFVRKTFQLRFNALNSGMELKITRPTLLLDLQKMEANLDRMLDKASRTGTELIPHFKTHQSKEVAELVRQKGVSRITVSSVKMAEYFASAGWKDITIAFPFNILEAEVINRLLAEGVKITILVSDADLLPMLDGVFHAEVQVLVEIDAGYGRSGIAASDRETLKSIVEAINKNEQLVFYGLYCHPGNTYHADSIEDIRLIWSSSIKKMNLLKNLIAPMVDQVIIRMGDTPGCTVVEDMRGVDEIGPGNFIFYDLVMNYLNVCDETDIAVAVACPVVAKYSSRNQVVIHGGAVHFSKDHLFDEHEQKFFGELVIIAENDWSRIIPDAKLVSLSQEHGILQLTEEVFEKVQIGDVLGFLPIHSCLTANLLKSYVTLSGERMEHLENI
ncbi:alanine racemase [Roseivirga sp.]|uniref:alanine racemase n=1 Tax=Roseivirga sp. TaxID=1964215 RepID=UPI003B51AC09